MNYHAPILLLAIIVGFIYCINLSGYYWEAKDKIAELYRDLAKAKDEIKRLKNL